MPERKARQRVAVRHLLKSQWTKSGVTGNWRFWGIPEFNRTQNAQNAVVLKRQLLFQTTTDIHRHQELCPARTRRREVHKASSVRWSTATMPTHKRLLERLGFVDNEQK
jgi:hypothetical protein